MDSLETVTAPLPGKEVKHEQPWKTQRKLQMGSQAAGQEVLVDVTCTLHGVRVRGGNAEAVVFLQGELRGKEGNGLGASGQMTGTAVIDLKSNQIVFADANLNVDMDLGSGRDSFQANGTMKIVMQRKPLEGAERDKAWKDVPPALVARAHSYIKEQQFDNAIADYQEAIRLAPDLLTAYNGIAWLLATCKKDSVRDGMKAVEYATKACELTKWKEAFYKDTLAAAYAENGQFDLAVKHQTEALQSPEFVRQYGEDARKRLASFQMKKPWRE
jgi:tetratricopeptide (TPR) repeat protein